MAVTQKQTVENETDAVVLALTGPPAAGKSTAVTILRDMGVPCKDTGDAIRDEAHRRHNGSGEPDEDYIWDIAGVIREEHGPAGPTMIAEDWIDEQIEDGSGVICVSSIREQAEADWLRENVGTTLVVRIDADSHARTERYVDSKLENEEREAVSRERVQELREELYERELREQPYPKHDVQIRNENSIQMRDLWEKLENVVTALDA